MTLPAQGTRPVLHPVLVDPDEPVLEVAGIVQSSAVDGPGNRYVVFLQGCNFNCAACHNPTTIGRCDGCGNCVEHCPHQALAFTDEGIAYDPASCDHCRVCVTVCPIDADPTIRLMTPGDLVAELRPLAPFLSGITVTGGEPTLQLDGLVALLTAIKTDGELGGMTTLLDTNGTLTRSGWERLLPVLDGAMVDLQAFRFREHDPSFARLHLTAAGSGRRAR